MTEAGGNQMNVSIILHGLKNRELAMDDNNRIWIPHQYKCNAVDILPYKPEPISRDKLIAEARQLALEASKELFIRFNWKQPNIEILRSMQETRR